MIPVVAGRVLGLRRDARAALERAPRIFRSPPGPRPTAGEIREDALLPILNQGPNLGACGGFAAAAAIWMRAYAQGDVRIDIPSPNWLYYQGRVLDKTVDRDAGVTYASLFQGAANVGYCPESAWPYDGHKTGGPHGDGDPSDSFRRMPDDAIRQAYDQCLPDGSQFGMTYSALDERSPTLIDDLCFAIADGYPVCLGADVDETFCANGYAPHAVLEPPTDSLGGHAMVAVAFFDVDGDTIFKVRNSWGIGEGDGGYVYFSERYMRTCELWIVERVPIRSDP